MQEAEQFIRKRQKLIKIADRSKDGWLGVQEYESDDLASNSEDEKHLKKVKNAAEKEESWKVEVGFFEMFQVWQR